MFYVISYILNSRKGNNTKHRLYLWDCVWALILHIFFTLNMFSLCFSDHLLSLLTPPLGLSPDVQAFHAGF